MIVRRSASCEADRPRDYPEIVGEQHDVGRPRWSAASEPDDPIAMETSAMASCKAVHAVADDANSPARTLRGSPAREFVLELADVRDFVLGEELGVDAVEVELIGDGLRGGGVVAREHHQGGRPERGVLRRAWMAGADGVGEDDDPACASWTTTVPIWP